MRETLNPKRGSLCAAYGQGQVKVTDPRAAQAPGAGGLSPGRHRASRQLYFPYVDAVVWLRLFTRVHVRAASETTNKQTNK